MSIPQELQTATDRMKTAQQALIDYIDSGGSDPSVRLAMLEEVNDSMRVFNEALARVLGQYES